MKGTIKFNVKKMDVNDVDKLCTYKCIVFNNNVLRGLGYGV